MDPRAVLQPVGPLPARVYWARRLIALGLLVVVVAVVAVSCSRGSTPKRPSAAAPHPSPSVSPTGSTEPSACTRVQLSVTAASDATTYAAGVLPRLSVTIRNRSARTCRFADAAATRTWSIFSGADQVWSDAGCLRSHAIVERSLAPGASLRHALVWDRRRSGPQCAPSTTADPGTYRLYVTVRGQRSPAAVFHLTG